MWNIDIKGKPYKEIALADSTRGEKVVKHVLEYASVLNYYSKLPKTP